MQKVNYLLIVMVSLLCGASVQAARPAFSGIFASAENAETVYNNPAGMSRLSGTQMTAQAILIAPLSQFEVDEELTDVAGGNPREPGPAAIPAFYYARQYQEDWHFGVSVNVPTGFGSNNGPDWAGRYYSDEFTLFYLTISPSVAYKLSDSLSVGAGLSAVYTSSESKTSINNDPFQAGAPDGRLEAEADGWGFGWSLSALYEFTDKTRFGLIFRSEVDADLEATLDFKDAIRPPGVIEELQGQKVNIASTTPMALGAGIFHEFDGGWQFTWDILWLEFSQFGATEITISDNDIDAPDDLYEDFFASSVGLSWPLRNGLRASVGLLYLEQPIEDENRGFSIGLDEMWGVGGGVAWDLDSGNALEMNLNLIDTGESPIDTGRDPIKGRVVGESEDHYAITVDISYHWK